MGETDDGGFEVRDIVCCVAPPPSSAIERQVSPSSSPHCRSICEMSIFYRICTIVPLLSRGGGRNRSKFHLQTLLYFGPATEVWGDRGVLGGGEMTQHAQTFGEFLGSSGSKKDEYWIIKDWALISRNLILQLLVFSPRHITIG